MKDLSVVISDWSPLQSEPMLSSIVTSRHPFAKAIVISPNDVSSTFSGSVASVEFQSRHGKPDSADLCTAKVDTTWFVMVNSLFYLKADVEIFVYSDVEGSRPLLSFEDANDDSCFSHSTCTRDIKLAQEIISDFSTVYDDFDFVFHTESRNEYCQFLHDTANSTWFDSPSAISYVAYLQKTGLFDSLYAVSDRRMFGSQFMFQRRDLSSLSDPSSAILLGRNLRELQKCIGDKGPYKCPKKPKKPRKPKNPNPVPGPVPNPPPGPAPKPPKNKKKSNKKRRLV